MTKTFRCCRTPSVRWTPRWVWPGSLQCWYFSTKLMIILKIVAVFLQHRAPGQSGKSWPTLSTSVTVCVFRLMMFLLQEAKYHMKRCIDSGLWVPNSRVDEDGDKDEGDEPQYEEVKKEDQWWVHTHRRPKQIRLTRTDRDDAGADGSRFWQTHAVRLSSSSVLSLLLFYLCTVCLACSVRRFTCSASVCSYSRMCLIGHFSQTFNMNECRNLQY